MIGENSFFYHGTKLCQVTVLNVLYHIYINSRLVFFNVFSIVATRHLLFDVLDGFHADSNELLVNLFMY